MPRCLLLPALASPRQVRPREYCPRLFLPRSKKAPLGKIPVLEEEHRFNLGIWVGLNEGEGNFYFE